LCYLRKVYTQAINHPDIVGIAIATRPDCLDEPILELLSELNKIKKIWVELGLQTIHEKSAVLIRRGYPLKTFDEAVEKLHMRNIEVVVHLIIGLPYETKEQMFKTLDYVVSKPIQGIKLQLLHVLKNTDLATVYAEDGFAILSLTAYVDLIIDCIERTPTNIVFHRITGDGPKNLLIAPQWSADKKNVLNTLQRRLKERTSFQGKVLQ
ncbi:MAG: TIGR01212 family radical SAM protein, partial [Vallitaleaceae bacterium]|nr:TIGR01212 family radical SAM protein [Vallitaleaceae bacterium]